MTDPEDDEEYVANIFEDSGFEVIWTKGTGFKDKNNQDILQIDIIAFYKKICMLIEVTTSERLNAITQKVSRFKDSCKLLIEKYDINDYLKQLSDKGIKTLSRKIIHNDLKFMKLFVASNLEGIKIPLPRVDDVKLWGKEILTYFDIVSDTINEYTRFELFSFFRINSNDLEGDEDAIQPKNAYALKFSVEESEDETITFISTPRSMLKMVRVLRRDSYNPDSYQRLVDERRLRKIRDFIIDKNGYFPNNILVSVSKPPKDFIVYRSGKINFQDDFEQFYLIDGQHRLFAFSLDNTAEHYKKYNFSEPPTGVQKQKYQELKEKDEKIKNFLDEKCLIITVLNFREPKKIERLKKEAQTFVDINFNQVKVKTELIYDIAWDVLKSRMPEAFASVIIKKLNKENIFKDMFRKRSYEKNKLSYVSIIKSGLKDLVDSNPDSPGELFKSASDDVKTKFANGIYDPFIDHCVKILKWYFEIINEVYCQNDDMWDPQKLGDYKLISSTSLTGFVRLLRHFLIFYDGDINKKKIRDILSKIDFDFTDRKWLYGPSEWSQFEKDFIRKIKNYSGREKAKPFSEFGTKLFS